MTTQEFQRKAEEIISSDAPENDPVCGKDRLMGNLLVEAYEDDVEFAILGDAADYHDNQDLQNFSLAITHIEHSGKTFHGVVCFTSPEIAEKKKYHDGTCEFKVSALLNTIYLINMVDAIAFNHSVEGKEIILDRRLLTKCLTPPIRRKLRVIQGYAKSNGLVPRNANLPFLG